MRHVLVLLMAAFPVQAQEKGWIDLMPGKDFAGWKRVPLPPDERPGAKNPWSHAAGGKVLLCDGVDVKEMLLTDKEFGDGTFHVEWRFRPSKDRTDYNGGVYVRSRDGRVWVQVQVAHPEKPPRLGDIFADLPVMGKTARIVVEGTGPAAAKPVGQWNVYDIDCRGNTIAVRVNGKPTTVWKDCPLPRGRLGLQAEFFFLEFRELRFRPAE